MTAPGWYHRLSHYFKQKFGRRVIKIPLHAGLTCPNRDGTLSTRGCIYCYNPAFSPAAAEQEHAEKAVPSGIIRRQIRSFQWHLEQRGKLPPGEKEPPSSFIPAGSYLAYFQSYSNTYGPLPLLERLYREALETPGVLGLSVATRPDCLGEDVLALLSSLARHSHIWLELGLQSAHDRTLKLINRGHSFACFQETVQACRGSGLFLCAHLISGLPGEDRTAMLETAERISALPLHGVKFHQLQVIAGTSLESLYRRGAVAPLSLEEYLTITCDQLEVLRTDIVVHRLLAETPLSELLLAPVWHVPRARFATMVEAELHRRGTCQGYAASPGNDANV